MANKFFNKSLIVTLAFLIGACTTPPAEKYTAFDQSSTPRDAASAPSDRNLLNFKTVFNINDYSGKTFLTFMRKEVKPALDKITADGFQPGDRRVIENALDNVDRSIAKEAIRGAGSKERLLDIADKLAQQGKMSFNDMPAKISKAGGRDAYGLTTFYALASGGGVAVRIDNKNITYNVNYDPKEERSGRSFAEGPGHKSIDASYKFYLQTLEDYVRREPEDLRNFYTSILEILIKMDASNYRRISDDGQTVGGDFIAVYIAEQDRHLMSNLKTHHWDEAHLETTLLAAFHSGQDKIRVMYKGELADKVFPQSTGCSPKKDFKRAASLIDYWQFSDSTDPKNCSRSGVNVTRRDFRALGKYITGYIAKKNPSLVKKVQSHLKGVRPSGNLYADLSSYLINFKTPSSIEHADALVEDYVEFLMESQKISKAITTHILKSKGQAEEM